MGGIYLGCPSLADETFNLILPRIIVCLLASMLLSDRVRCAVGLMVMATYAPEGSCHEQHSNGAFATYMSTPRGDHTGTRSRPQARGRRLQERVACSNAE